MGRRKRLARALNAGHTVDVQVPAGHGSALFAFTPDGLYVHTDCCGARVPRRKAKKLRRLLKAWLTQR